MTAPAALPLGPGAKLDVRGIATRVHASSPEAATPTVVMLHGGDPRSLSHSADFSTVWSTTPSRPRLVAYDKPGQGWSFDAADPALGSDAQLLVDHLVGVVEATTTGPVVLLGHSRGALPVVAAALTGHPRLRGVVIVSSNTLAPPSPLTPADFYPRMYATAADGPDDAYIGREAAENSFDGAHVGDLAAARRPVALQPGWWASRTARHEAHDRVLRPGLEALRERALAGLTAARLPLPVLTLWGLDDVSAPEALAAGLLPILRSGFRSCDYVALSQSRHYVYRDRADAFAGHLDAWLDRLPGWRG